VPVPPTPSARPQRPGCRFDADLTTYSITITEFAIEAPAVARGTFSRARQVGPAGGVGAVDETIEGARPQVTRTHRLSRRAAAAGQA